MLGLKLAVTLGGETHVIEVRQRDIIELERKFNVPASKLTEGRLEHVLFLGWQAARRVDLYRGSFDEFIDEAEVGADAAEADPTSGAASTS